MLTIDKIPEDIKEALRLIQTVISPAVIAGGCLRDLDHDVPFKDVDVFIPAYGHDDFVQAVLNISNALGADDTVIRAINVDEYRDWNALLIGVQNFTFRGLDIQVIGLDPMETERGVFDIEMVVRRIDFGLCQIGFDGRLIQRTLQYEIDKDHYTFTLRPSALPYTDLQRSVERWVRLRERYPNHALVVRPLTDEAAERFMPVTKAGLAERGMFNLEDAE